MIENPAISKSNPFLSISKIYNVPYWVVLSYADHLDDKAHNLHFQREAGRLIHMTYLRRMQDYEKFIKLLDHQAFIQRQIKAGKIDAFTQEPLDGNAHQ